MIAVPRRSSTPASSGCHVIPHAWRSAPCCGSCTCPVRLPVFSQQTHAWAAAACEHTATEEQT